MKHSKSAQPHEVLAFFTHYRSRDATTLVMAVLTTYSHVTEETLHEAGVKVIGIDDLDVILQGLKQ